VTAATELPLSGGLPFPSFFGGPHGTSAPLASLRCGAFSCGRLRLRAVQPTLRLGVELAGLPLMIGPLRQASYSLDKLSPASCCGAFSAPARTERVGLQPGWSRFVSGGSRL